MLCVPLMTLPFCMYGLPLVLHKVASNEARVVVTVSHASFPFKRKRCSGKVYIEEYRLNGEQRVCGIQEEQWSALASGDKIILFGDKSIFGFTYERYKVTNL